MNNPARQNGTAAAGNVSQMLRTGAAPARSEATGIEMSRAVAEVQAMVVIAHQRPRDVTRAIEAMKMSCSRMALAERAFFSFRRGGSSVNGASVHLARELARCWGNIDYGLSELDRDDFRGRSELLAFAWDLETNQRSHAKFIVPHMRDKTGGAVPLTDMRDIYENNANHGARRMREQIFATLPVWFREEAIALCRETLEKGESQDPLPLRISKMLAAYAEIGISRERVEARFGGNVDNMTVVDLANYGILFRSIKNGEANKDEEFPPVTAGQVSEILKTGSQPAGSHAGGPAGGQAGSAQPAAGGATSAATSQPARQEQQLTNEGPDDLIPVGAGQEEIAGKVVALITAATTVDRVKAIQDANAERMKGWSNANRVKVSNAAEGKIEDLQKL